MAFRFLPLILIAVMLVEISLFVVIGSRIGVLATIALVVATSILGSILLRIQGFGVLQRMRATMQQGGAPGRELVHGLMIMIAGVLLLVPGFFTDTVGLLLFVPPVREFAWRFLRSRIVIVTPGYGSGPGGYRRSRDGRTIDLDEDEYRKDEAQPPRRDAIDDQR